MAGSSLEPSKDLKYINEIPDEFRATTKIVVKARIRICGDSLPIVAVVAATTEGRLLIFSKNKLMKNCILSVKDVKKILIYQHPKTPLNQEFVIVFSHCGSATVFDLENLSVVKAWNNIMEIYIKDYFSFGYPQVILHLQDESSPIVVTCESNWENIIMCTENSCDTKNPMLESISLGLEAQLRNSFLNLHQTQRKISMRKSFVNRSLNILKDQLMNQTTTKRTPSFLMETVGPDSITGNCLSNNLLETSALWDGVINNYWVIGTTVTNSSERELKDVQCVLTTENASIKYKTYSFSCNFGKILKSSTQNTLFPNCGNLSTACSMLDRRIKSNDSFNIIVIVSVPEFVNSDCEKGNLLLTCCSSDNIEPTKNIQINLGTVQLKFEDLHNRRISIEPTHSDPSQLYRRMLAMMSALDAEENVGLSSSFKTASDNFNDICEELKIIKIVPLQWYYFNGVCGHVVITIQKETTYTLEMTIRAQSTLHVKWFIRSLKSVIGDTVKLNPLETCTVLESFPFQRNISSVLNLLANAECSNELTLIEEYAEGNVTASDSGIDLVRKEFSRKQLKLQTVNRQGNIDIPYADYHQWQKIYYN